MNRHHFIGDVHGERAALRALMDTLAPQAGDIVVFLGDLVDKGPDALGVVRAVRDMAENAPFDVVLIEGNHEDLHRRYRRNLVERPEIAAEQAARHADLAPLTDALSVEDLAFLNAAVPFYRVDGLLAVHGGIPGDMKSFPQSVAESENLTGKEKRAFSKILRTRFTDKDSGAFVANGDEADGDPFWADVYDGRFGKIVFGHTPFMDGIAQFAQATGIDTGAVYGGTLTAMTIDPDCSTRFTSVAAR